VAPTRSSAFKAVLDSRGVPRATACRSNTASIESLSNVAEVLRASLLNFADHRDHLGCMGVRCAANLLKGAVAGLGEPWVSQGNPSGLRGCQCCSCGFAI
jgi:hypothetical protein